MQDMVRDDWFSESTATAMRSWPNCKDSEPSVGVGLRHRWDIIDEDGHMEAQRDQTTCHGKPGTCSKSLEENFKLSQG